MAVSTSVGVPRATSADEQQDAARKKLLQTFVDEFVPITPGRREFPKSFQMGNANGAKAEQPVHEVTLSRVLRLVGTPR